MLLKLILLLTVVPLVELLLLVRLTHLWGSFWITVGVILGTGLLGAALARHEGLRVLARVRDRLARGEIPTDDLLDGLLILVAGVLLVTPGLITDACGFVLLVPPGRGLVRRLLKGWMKAHVRAGEWEFHRAVEFRPIRDEPPPGSPPLEDENV